MCLLVICRKAFFPKQKEEEQGENSASAVIRREYAKLGPITSVLCLFGDIYNNLIIINNMQNG